MITDKKPDWLKVKVESIAPNFKSINQIKEKYLCTVCVEALCPNQMECFHKGTATFMLLGPSCTRNCTFCAVDKSTVMKPDLDEPDKIAAAIKAMEINYCVLTMVTRDDLSDGGAHHICDCVAAIKKNHPDILVELLISDLAGNRNSLTRVLNAHPEVLNHNIETVERLYPQVRPQAEYSRSLTLIHNVSQIDTSIIAKSGLMLGLGESREEVLKTINDLFDTGCRILTLGQYLAPSKKHFPVKRYVPPEEFEYYSKEAKKIGFFGVASAPLVRSSYQAEQLYRNSISLMDKANVR